MVSPAFRTITRLILVNSVACVCGAVVLSVLSLSASAVQAAPQPDPTPVLLHPIVPVPPHGEQALSDFSLRDAVREAERSDSANPRESRSASASSSPIVSGSIELISGTLSQDWGDFDRDGYLDLALGTTDGISVYHNLSGQLIEPAWSLPGDAAYGVRWADLDGDGRLELAAVGGEPSAGRVRNPIYRFDGNGFTPTGVFTSDYQLARIIALPGATLDLIASTTAISVPCPVLRFHNNGRGQFPAAPQCVSASATAAIGTADVDSDGYFDLVMGRFPNSLVYLKNKTGVLTDTNGISVFDTSPFWPYDFAWGDYDGDGYLDLAAAFPLQRQARIYHNERPGANPPFKLAGLIATQRYMTPLSVDWGDFNGDGALDLAVTDDPPKIVFNVNQSIGPGSASLTLGNNPTHENLWSTRAVALNNSNLDLSLSDQTGPGKLVQMVAGHLQTQITPITGAIAANGVAWGDANGDGQIDLVLSAGSVTERSMLYWNVGGVFSAASANDFPLDGSQRIVVGDLGKRDGFLEAVVGTSSGNIRTYTLTNAAPVLANSWGTGVPIGAVALGDYNNDGWLDLLTGGSDGSIAIYANSRARLNSVPVFTARESNPVRSVAWADYNADLYMDFAVATNPGAVYVYLNNQDGMFNRAFTFNETTSNTALAWGDFNGDGRPDLAVGSAGQGVKLYANQNGQLSTQSIWTSSALNGTTSLAWGDWNNDSRPDLAVGNDDGPVQVYSNLGSQPGAPQFTLTWSSQEGGSTTGVAWGDANRDGYLDLAVSRSSGVSGVYRNTSVLPWRLPNPPAYLSIARPGKTLDAYLYSSSELLPGYFDVLPLTVAPTVTVYYSAYHTAGMPITNSVFEYSLDGGSTWATASAAISTALSSALTQTAAAGRSGVFIWDAQADGAISDNAVFRVRAADQNSTGPVQRAAVAAISPPFRVRGLSCIWPNGLSIDYSPKTIAPFAQVRFVGILAESSSDVMTYTWNFDDGTFGNGKEVTHAFDQEGFYTVRLSAVSATCPTPQPLQAIRVVKVGNPSPFKLYLPLVAKNSTSAQALSVSQAARPPANLEAQPVTAPRSTIPSVASSTCLALPIASLTSPTVPWITATTGYMGQPALNADGTRLAFWSTANLVGGNPDGNIELYYGQIDRVGSCITVSQITSSTGSILQGFNLGPSLNAAGDRVAFYSDRDLIPGENPELNFEIFLARITGSGISLTQITSTTDRVSVAPSLDAAGTHLAFASDQDLNGASANADGNQEIFVATIDAAGTVVLSATQVTATGVGTFNDEPAISADGQQIAFVRGGNLSSGGIQEIFVTGLGQNTANRVTTSTLDVLNYHPTLNSDGTRLAFASATIATGTLNLAIISGTNMTITPLSTLTLGDQPALNAGDGSRVTTISNHQQVNVLNLSADSTLPVFSCSSPNCESPAISGDGMHVAFASGSTLYVAYYETANLSITWASAIPTAVAGTAVTYTFNVVNHGPSLADSVEISGGIALNSGVTLTDVFPTGSCAITPQSQKSQFECRLSGLAVNAVMPIMVVVWIDPAKTDAFDFTSRASAWQKDSAAGNNTLFVSSAVETASDLQITKVAPAAVVKDASLSYTITLKNLGPSDARNVVVSDVLPAGTTFVTQTQLSGTHLFTLTNTSSQIYNTLDILPSDASAAFLVTVIATANGGTPLDNTAVATTDTPDPTPADNNHISSVTTIVHVSPVITSANSTIFTATQAGLFTVTATGYPTPTLSVIGVVPADVSFLDNHAGSGTLSGTPITDTGGPHPITFTANNAVGSVSQVFTLYVHEKPKVTTQPTDRAACEGSTVNFATAASGYPAPTVQWQRSDNGGGTWNDLPGETSTTLSFAAGVAQNGYRYRAVFSNVVGTATSNAVVLTVNTAPSITTQPANLTVNEGETAAFTIAASGSPLPSVQWWRSTNNGNTWGTLPGAISTTLSFTAQKADNNNRYRAVVSNTCGAATSLAAILTVEYGPVVTTHPQTQTVNAGTLVTFTAAADGNPAPTVQWQLSTDGGSIWNDISGATSTSYSFTTSAAQNGYQYRAVFTSSRGTATSEAATLTVVTQAPAITLQPVNQNVNAGNTVTFLSAASGIPVPTAQWQSSSNSGSSWDVILGATSPSYSFTAQVLQNGYWYRVIYSNGILPAATSVAVTLTVYYTPVVTLHPVNQTVTAGQLVTFTAAATGNPAPTVRWQVSTDNGGSWTDINGATSTSYSHTATAGENGRQYRARFTNLVGNAVSNAATLTVNTPPTVTQHPQNKTVTAGQTVTFTAAATGNPTPTVQWQVSTDNGTTWTDLPGEITTTLSFVTQSADDKKRYRAVFTNSVSSTASNSATLNLN